MLEADCVCGGAWEDEEEVEEEEEFHTGSIEARGRAGRRGPSQAHNPSFTAGEPVV